MWATDEQMTTKEFHRRWMNEPLPPYSNHMLLSSMTISPDENNQSSNPDDPSFFDMFRKLFRLDPNDQMGSNIPGYVTTIIYYILNTIE